MHWFSSERSPLVDEMATVNPGNNPYAGGGFYPAAPPTSGPTGTIASANVGSTLLGGVNAGTPRLARVDRGTNVSVPYARVCLHPGSRTALPANPGMALPKSGYLGKPDAHYLVETEGLNSGRIAFILGRRGTKYEQTAVGELVGPEGQNVSKENLVTSRVASRLHQFAVGGLDMNAMHRLCSFEYLQSYFFYALRNTVIDLDTPLDDPESNAKFLDVAGDGGTYTVTNMDGKALYEKLTGVEQDKLEKKEKEIVESMKFSGVFAGDDSPFLRGKTLDSSRIGRRKPRPNQGDNPAFVSVDIGDKLAFEKLESLLKDKGLFDWMPDGICHSKLDSGEGAGPAGMDDEFDARDGQLFNITISGSSITTTWSDDSAMACLPMDKLFIVIVADVYTMEEGPEADKKKREDKLSEFKAEPAYQALVASGQAGGVVANYEAAFKAAIGADSADSLGKKDRGKTLTEPKQQYMTNFQVKRMTSSQIVNYSAYVPGTERSRLGLPVGAKGGRYIVGGWCLGTVTDCAAASSVRENGALMGTGTKRKSSGYALGLMVNIQWFSGDQMYRKFCDRPTADAAPKRGVTRSRYDAFAQIPALEAEPLSRRKPKPSGDAPDSAP